VECPSDSKGNKYVVIKILPFKEIPVFSKTDIEGELKANMLYYRNTNRRVESAPVSNPHDLRDIIELAAMKLMQRRKNYGFNVESQELQILDQEISKLPESEILNKIKSRGYWEIRFSAITTRPSKIIRLPGSCRKVTGKIELELSLDTKKE
jgi:hypothetical protein